MCGNMRNYQLLIIQNCGKILKKLGEGRAGNQNFKLNLSYFTTLFSFNSSFFQEKKTAKTLISDNISKDNPIRPDRTTNLPYEKCMKKRKFS